MIRMRLSRFVQGLASCQAGLYLRCLAFLLLVVVGMVVSTACDFPFYGGPLAWCVWYADCCACDDKMEMDMGASAPGVRMEAQSTTAKVWLEFGATGIYTPVVSHRGLSVQTPHGETPPLLDDLVDKGYVAIRVPHAPPTYTASSLLPGVPPGDPHGVAFSYYSPPSTTTLTTMPVTVTRRTDYEAIVNDRFPIEDGQSHWEVWWLPQGAALPIPHQPLRLDHDSIPRPLEISVQVDLVDAHPHSLAGSDVGILFYNGYVFIGPYEFPVHYIGDSAPLEPLARFGTTCAYSPAGLFPSIGGAITPTVPFTHVHCLENWDEVTRTFTVTAHSSQGWSYTHSYQTTDAGSHPVSVGGSPFTVTVGPRMDAWQPGVVGLLAVHVPAIADDAALRETFEITATSVVSPDVTAHAVSFALGPGYRLDEGAAFTVYLPLVMREP